MDTPPELVELAPGPAVAIRAHVSITDLPAFFAGAFAELAACAGDQLAGAPFAIYHAFDPKDVDVTAVFPLHAPVTPSGRVVSIRLDGGPAVQVKHVGPYEDLGQTYGLLEKWLAQHHRTRAGAVREMYLTGPSVPPTEQVTVVVQPLAARAA
jgi:effector-binding domain-containing protein